MTQNKKARIAMVIKIVIRIFLFILFYNVEFYILIPKLLISKLLENSLIQPESRGYSVIQLK